MAIKGVSEVVRLPRLGKIRLGVKKEGDSGMIYPSPTDYFVCPEEVSKVFGEKPKELRIMFPTEDPAQWASQFLRCYSQTRGLICRGDGETALARIDVKTGEIATRDSELTELREISCNPASCSYSLHKRCRRVMNLQFLLPDCPGFGVYQLDTSSFHSIVNINSSLELVHGVCGRFSMIPLYLRLVEQKYERNGHKLTVYVLNLIAPYSFSEIQKYAKIPPGQTLLVPAPDGEAPGDLFPDEILDGDTIAKDPCEADDELVRLWDEAKLRVWKFNIGDVQISSWFEKNYKIRLDLDDFDRPLPPEGLTSEQLSRFCHAIDRHLH